MPKVVVQRGNFFAPKARPNPNIPTMPDGSQHFIEIGPSFVSTDMLLSAIVDSSDDAIVSKNLQGVVTSWNKGAERIFGYTAAEMVGQPITKVIPPERLDEEPKILDRLKRGERVDHFDTVRMTKTGERVDVSLTISPVRDASGIVVGASKIARDITARKRGEAALVAQKAELLKATEEARMATEEAERQGRMKDEFLATLSHELRTPLQSILGWTQILLSDECEEEEFKQGLEVIDRNARAQTRIIEDLLDMSRILSGKVRLDVQQVGLATVLKSAVETVMPAAHAKKICVQAVLDPLAQPVTGDPNRLQQIFWNLLSNAIKFTPHGGKVQVLLERVNSHLEVSVTDTGEGIDPEFLPYVFERFRQADGSMTRRHGGLGLGLAIVKNLAELHGGSVRAKSGGFSTGATFTVVLPLAALRGHPEDETRRHPAGETPRRMVSKLPRLDDVSLLIVDDEDDARMLVATVLKKAGASVRTAGSAKEALALIKTAVPDVMISDIGMPVEDGYALIRAVRALPENQGGKVPAIALSAYTRTEDRIMSISAGFQMHLSKPADALELLTMVVSLAKSRSA
jgi:PAS domain S-box-containing protein